MEKLLSLSAKRIANEIIETIDLIDDILWEDYGRLEVGFKPSVVKVLPFKKDRQDFIDFLWNKFYKAKSYNFTGHRFKYRENEFVLTSEIDEETSEISAYLNTLGSQFKLVTF
mgnify:FL=1